MACGGPYGFDWTGEYGKNVPEDRIYQSYDLVKHNEEQGLIDPVSNLIGSPSLVVSGENDSLIPPILQEYTMEFYLNY